MENKLTKDEIKDILVGKKIIDVGFSPYINIKLDDNSEIEIIPVQLNISGFKYLDLTFKKNGDEQEIN